MTQKVNGHVAAGAHLGAALDFYTVTTTVDLTVAPNGVFATGLDKLIEVISLRGQPVIMAVSAGANSSTVVKFAIEHTQAWEVATPNLINSIVAHAGAVYGFTTGNTTVAKVAL